METIEYQIGSSNIILSDAKLVISIPREFWSVWQWGWLWNIVTQLVVAGFGHEGQNTLSSFVYDIELLERIPVVVRRLDEIASHKGLERLDVVKIDVEGSEVQVLKGASTVLNDLRPVVIIEAHDQALRTQDNSVKELLELLCSLGYTVNTFDPDTGSLGPVESCQMGLNVVAIPT